MPFAVETAKVCRSDGI